MVSRSWTAFSMILFLTVLPFVMGSNALQQEGTNTRADGHGWINGTVTDDQTKRPIAKCFVEIVGTTLNTYTDANGS